MKVLRKARILSDSSQMGELREVIIRGGVSERWLSPDVIRGRRHEINKL